MSGPVLVGVDASGVPLSWAVEWCRRTGDDLLVVSALIPHQAEMPPEWHDELVEQARLGLDARVGGLRSGAPLRLRSCVVDGEPSEVLTTTADDNDASLVVIGARGSGGFRGLGLGGVAHHLAHHLRRPLIIVPEPDGRHVDGTIIVGVDGSAGSAAALAWAVQAARRVGASIHAVYAYDPAANSYPHGNISNWHEQGEPAVREQIDKLDSQGVTVRTTIVGGHPVAVLTEIGARDAASLIVAGTRGWGNFHGLVLGRVPAQLPYHAGRPVAIIHHDR